MPTHNAMNNQNQKREAKEAEAKAKHQRKDMEAVAAHIYIVLKSKGTETDDAIVEDWLETVAAMIVLPIPASHSSGWPKDGIEGLKEGTSIQYTGVLLTDVELWVLRWECCVSKRAGSKVLSRFLVQLKAGWQHRGFMLVAQDGGVLQIR